MITSLLAFIVLVLDVIALVSVLQSDASTLAKVLWVIAILALPVVGMILYFLLGPGPRGRVTA
ncbi:MAG: hypothetical protein AMXMBFR58_30360 [Phycisphaerae bacterium]|nr:hypothetical protein [Phycisphaerales bacterium]